MGIPVFALEAKPRERAKSANLTTELNPQKLLPTDIPIWLAAMQRLLPEAASH